MYMCCIPIGLDQVASLDRINQTSRCPALYTIDKSTPLRPDFLEFRTNCIQVNKMSYQLSHCEQKYVESQSQKEDKSSRESLAPVADELVLDLKRGDILRLPENLKIWVKTLNSERTDFEEILPILDPSCLPLETLKLENARLHNLQNLVFRTAQNVEIWGVHDEDSDDSGSESDGEDGNEEEEEEEDEQELWLSEFQKLPNKNIFIDYRLYEQARIMDLIEFWMENGKEIGTIWNFGRRPCENLFRELDTIKKEIGGAYRRVSIRNALILPLNDASQLISSQNAKVPL
ncbi:hypothetical protein L5515_015791 [Caenorhabditis briggsae]|uniref:Uncharacterized protein n=1 Tax=Caenorhabditis briggsae TaxID=6238 RepID=A0AAE9J980_CAEBR|nr:hypothetical protein L5515_015791 [Caenorhabditis briggsae]